MKQKFTILLTALLLMSGLTWAQTTETLNIASYASANNWTNSTQYLTAEVGDVIFTAAGGGNTGKYYSSDQSWRFYANENATLTISVPSGSSLVSVTPTFTTKDNGILVYEEETITSGTNVSVSGEVIVFNFSQTSGNKGKVFFTEIEVAYIPGEAPIVAMPTFDPVSGTEFGDEGLQVSISCDTEDVDIYYTLDGSEPDDESIGYGAPITLTETTTIKAIAYDGEDNTSAVATATYIYVDPNTPGTITNPYTVAQARAAIDANTGTQDVYATGIVSEIPTAWSTQYNNITFNFVDNVGDTVFLQAYRCVSGTGVDASHVVVGDVVVVHGNLIYYQNTQTYEFSQGCQLVSLTHSANYVEAPTFSPAAGTYDEAQSVTISCATTGAAIYYTTDGSEPTDASSPYTGAINVTTTTTIKAIAYVGENASAVTTASYNIVSLANISDITEVGEAYEVQGTVVATSTRGFVMGDGTGYVYYYNGNAVSQSVGDMVKVSGTTGTYGQIIQFTNTATVTVATSSNYNGTPAATLITEVPDYSEGYHLSTYFEFEGALTKTGNSYFITLGEAQIQISYPTSDHGTTLSALDGKNVHVKGYFAGINSNSFFTVMLESVEEVVSTEPSITVTPTRVDVPFAEASGTLTVTYNNIEMELEPEIIWFESDGETPAAECDWIVVDFDENFNVDYVIDANTGDARMAYMKIYGVDAELNDVYSALITFSQGHFIADYATLPFTFDGGRADIANTDGLTQEGLDTDYSSSPKLKFNNTDDYVLLHFVGTPGTLTFDIKGNSFSGGTFTVQTSEDGETYTDLATYTDLTSNVQSERFDNLGENVRYIKWIYTEKVGGNVALGNIVLYEEGGGPAPEASITVNPATVDEDAEEHDGTLGLTYENLTISDMGDFDIQYYNAEGEETDEPDWIEVLVAEQDPTVGEGYVVSYFMLENEGETRTAYFKVYAMDDEAEFVYSNLVTITQAAPVAPFEPATYTLATTIESGKTYIIVGSRTVDEVTSYYAMGEQRGNNRGGYAISVDGTTATVGTADVHEVVITALDEEGFYSIYDGGYLYAAGSTKNYLRTQDTLDVNAKWSIRIDSVFHIVADSSANHNVMQFNYNNDNPIFSCYSSASLSPVYLYVKDETPTTVTQTTALVAGQNWFSTYVEITLDDLKAALVAAMPSARSIVIKSQNAGQTTWNGRLWTGQLRTMDVAQMYMITAPVDCEITLEGMPLDPAEHPLTINNGPNWIGFPFSESMTIANAFAGFASPGDIVKSNGGGQATWNGRIWTGQLKTLVPGSGYIYQSANASPRPFNYSTSK